MQITSTKIDNKKIVEFYNTELISNNDEKMIFLVESKDIPDDDCHIFHKDAALQVIYGGGESVEAADIKDFSFAYELAGATVLKITKK